MKRQWIRAFIMAAAYVSLVASPLYAAKQDSVMPSNALYRQITSHTGWLNTSRPLRAEDLKGRIILLDFWTYCCINCMHIMPDLTYLEERFGDKLTVIGVHSAKFANERDTENIRQAILRHDLRHPVVNDFDFTTWQAFTVHAWPTLILINPDGKIEQTYSGEGHRDDLEQDIKKLIKQYGDKVSGAPLPIALEKDKVPESVLSFPTKLTYSPDMRGHKVLFVADSGNQRILAVTLEGRVIEQIGSGKAGREDGDFDMARFTMPQGLAYRSQMLYIADTGNHLLRVAHLDARQVSTLAGTGKQGYEREVTNGAALSTPLASPWDVAFYPDQQLTIAMAGTHQLWRYDPAAKSVGVVAGNGRESIDDGSYPANSLSQPSGLATSAGALYFVDAETSSLRMLKGGKVTTLIGHGLFDFGFKNGTRRDAQMQHPLGLAADDRTVYIADSYNHAIRSYDIKTGVLSTLSGTGKRGNTDGALKDASFNEPNDIALIEGKLYVADTNNNAIRIIDLEAQTVSTLAIKENATIVDAFSDALPNLTRVDAQKVSSQTPVTVRFGLGQGWKVNRQAPSSLTLFAIQDKNYKALARFNPEQMHDKRVLLPKLAAGEYRLQGTIYYCESREGAQCLIKSFDVMITADKEGKPDFSLPF